MASNPEVNSAKKNEIVPTSAPLRMKDMSEEQREEYYKAIRARMRESRITVRGNSEKSYYWARKDDLLELSRLEWIGYEIVKEADLKNPQIQATGLKADGTYVLGDVILMQIDKEVAEFLDQENARRAKNLVQGAVADFVSDAQKERVPTFERGEDPNKLSFHK